jgi:hypothetical protein
MADKKRKKRSESSEEDWKEYQRHRNSEKANRYKQRNAQKVVEWRRRVKLALIEYKGGKCEICGYNKNCPNCYDFHHKNPEEKEFSISGKTWSYDRLKAEVDKCVLLCKNCHAEIHDKLFKESRENTIKRLNDSYYLPPDIES